VVSCKIKVRWIALHFHIILCRYRLSLYEMTVYSLVLHNATMNDWGPSYSFWISPEIWPRSSRLDLDSFPIFSFRRRSVPMAAKFPHFKKLTQFVSFTDDERWILLNVRDDDQSNDRIETRMLEWKWSVLFANQYLDKSCFRITNERLENQIDCQEKLQKNDQCAH